MKEQTSLSPEIENKLQDIKKSYTILVCFAGSHGIANALDYLIDAGSLLSSTHQKERIGFILVGSGSEKSKLQAKAGKLQNIFFLIPYKKLKPQSFLNKWIFCT